MPKPQAFTAAQLDELRVKFATRASDMASLLDRRAREANARGDLHAAEDLDWAIDAALGFVEDVAFLAEHGRVAVALDRLPADQPAP